MSPAPSTSSRPAQRLAHLRHQTPQHRDDPRPKRGDKLFRDDLLFKTIDGNDISLDVIVSYRIDRAKAPDLVQRVATSDFELKDKVVRTIARSRPPRHLRRAEDRGVLRVGAP